MFEDLEGKALLDALVSAGPDALGSDSSAHLEQAKAWSRVQRWVEASRLEAIGRFLAASEAERDGRIITSVSEHEEYARCLNLTNGQATFDLQEAERLTTHSRAALEAMKQGRISQRAAKAIANEIGKGLRDHEGLDDTTRLLAEHVAERAAVYAETHSSTETAKRTKQLLAAVDLSAVRKRFEDEWARRDVQVEYGSNGISWFTFAGRTDQIARIEKLVDAAARTDLSHAHEADTRTLAQLKADLCVGMFLMGGAMPAEHDGYELPLALLPAPRQDPIDDVASTLGYEGMCDAVEGELARPGVRPVQVKLTFGWDSWIGLNENPALIDGTIPLPAHIARTLVATSEFRRLITDPATGELLDLSPHTYRIPQRLDEFVRERDPECIINGCHRPAVRCDLDHRVPYNHHDPRVGGTTTRANLAPLCRKHHLLKTHHGFQLRQLEDGELYWITPSGRSYKIQRNEPLVA